MSYPTLPDKFQYSSFTSADRFISKITPDLKLELVDNNTFPETVIMTYDNHILKQIVKENKSTKVKLFAGESYFLPKLGNYVVTGNFGIGAPAVTALLELYIALGIKNFYTIGYAGSLVSDLAINDIVLCVQAIPDDGVTQHYLGNVTSVDANPKTISFLEDRAKKHNIPINKKKVWSTSAIFRETSQEINYFREKEVAVVDMEAAAVLSLAKIYDIQVTVLMIISDIMEDGEWKLGIVNEGMRKQKIRELMRLCQ